MTRIGLVLLLSGIAACGGRAPATTSPEPTAAAEPDTTTRVYASATRVVPRTPIDADADTLFAEYVTTDAGQRTYPVPAMLGEVRCYGGPALDGNVPAEVYVRRAVNRSAVVEDVVRIFPDDLVPRRRMVTMLRGPGVSDLTSAGSAVGRALIEDAAGARSVQLHAGDGAGYVLTASRADADAMRLVSLTLDPAQVEDSQLSVDDLDSPEAWNVAQARVIGLARRATLLSVKGDLPAIDAERCEAIFARFPTVASD